MMCLLIVVELIIPTATIAAVFYNLCMVQLCTDVHVYKYDCAPSRLLPRACVVACTSSRAIMCM